MIYTKNDVGIVIKKKEKHNFHSLNEINQVDELVYVHGCITRIDDLYDERGLRAIWFYIEDETDELEINYFINEDLEIELFNEFSIGDEVIVYGSVMDDLFREIYRIYATDIIRVKEQD